MTFVCILIITLTSNRLWCWISKNGADNGDSCLGNQSGAISLQLAYWFTVWSEWYPSLMNSIQWCFWIALAHPKWKRVWDVFCVWHLSLAVLYTLAIKMWIFQDSDRLICWDQSMLEVKELSSWLCKVFDP